MDVHTIAEKIESDCQAGKLGPNPTAYKIAKAAILKAMPGWQPIETAPKDGTPVLVSDGKVQYVAWYKSGWCFLQKNGTFYCLKEAKYWQHLQPSPEVQG